MSGRGVLVEPPVRVAPRYWAIALALRVYLVSLSCSERVHTSVSARVPTPSRRIVRRWLVGGLALHVGEAVYAHRHATRAGFHATARRWTLTTFVVGAPTLVALRSATASHGVSNVALSATPAD